MKKTVLVIFVMVLAASVSAQDMTEKRWNAYLGAGVAMPMGDFGDLYNLGLHGAGAFGYSVTPQIQVRGKIEFHTFGVDEDFALDVYGDPLGENTGFDGGGLNAIMFGVDGKYNFAMENASLSPFVLVGLGMASLSIQDIDITVDGTPFTFEIDGTTEFYFELGGGVEIPAGESFSIFIQARYVSIQTEGDASSFIPITAGVKF